MGTMLVHGNDRFAHWCDLIIEQLFYFVKGFASSAIE